jgi:hypothetical protein
MAYHKIFTNMRTFARAVFFAVFLTGVFVASAKADTVYTYTGGTFTYATGVYVPGDQVTGTFTLSSSFVPALPSAGLQLVDSGVVSWSFTDGHQTLTQLNSTGSFYVGFSSDGTPILPHYGLPYSPFLGLLNGWEVNLGTPTSRILTVFDTASSGDYTVWAGLGCSNHNQTCTSSAVITDLMGAPYAGFPGTWTIQVPEGGTTALFLFVGLAGLTILTLR